MQSRSEIEEGEIGDDDEFDDGYDENLMGDDEDQRRLALMTEKEREQELFNRSEQREILKTRFKLQRKILLKRKSEEEKKQTKQVRNRKRLRASEIYSSDESDEYTPDNTKSGGDSNFSRKASNKVVTRSNNTIISSSSSSSSSSSASASEDESSDSSGPGVDNDGSQEVNSRQIQDDFVMTLADLRSLQLKRDKIQKWIYEPFFAQTAIGLFVKISVANPVSFQTTGVKQPSYKIAKVVDVKKIERTYFVNTETNQGKTDLCFLLRIGRTEKSYQLSFVSNKAFDESDYAYWLESMRALNEPMPSRDHFQRKLKDLHKANHYVYTDEDIERRIKEKSRFQHTPCNFALKKTELLGQKADAEANGDLDLAKKLQQELDELEDKARHLEKERSSKTFSAISYVNERNRMKNIVDCERALRESKIVRTEDPFTRRKCTPQIVHNKNNGNNAKNSPLASNDNSSDIKSNNDTTSSQTTGEQKKGSSHHKLQGTDPVNDLFQAHADIELDIDI